PVTRNIDPELARAAVTPRTKAVLAVHLFGRPARIEELPDLPLLEDAAGALGGRRKDRACGSLGVAASLSFNPRKIVTTGEGGAVTTDDDHVADAIRRLRHLPVLLPEADPGDVHGWQAYVIQVERRDDVLAALRTAGIEAQIGTYA